MKIVEVSYRSLKTGSGYNNTSVEAKALVEWADTPEETLAKLRHWVDAQVDETLKRTDAYEKLSDINERLGSARSEYDRLGKRIAAFRELLADKPQLAALAREAGFGGDALLVDLL